MQTIAPVSSPSLEITASPQFNSWLSEQKLSLAFTTYQTNRLFFVGYKDNGRLAIHERLLDKPMGLYAKGDRLYLSTRYQIWDFQNFLAQGEKYGEADRLYVPRHAQFTGDLNVHDLVVDDAQQVIFVNTDFSCLGTLSQDYSFIPRWQPHFISKLVAEDRCHLNGLAMVEGKPTYVTACSATDTAAGWRNHRLDGGIVMDVAKNEIIATGLSMPHSPRYYQGKLWLLNSGTGELGYLENGQFVPLTFCPGFVRGLAFYGDFAFVGLSKLRSQSFTGLELENRLNNMGTSPQCGLMVIDLKTGNPLHWLYFEAVIEELFDIVILPGVRQPQAIGLQQDEIQRLVTFPNSGGIVTTKPTAKRPSQGATPPIAGLPTEKSIPPLSNNPQSIPPLLSNSQTIPPLLSNSQTIPPFLSNSQTIPPFLSNSQTIPPFLRGVRGDQTPVETQNLGAKLKYQRVYHLNTNNILDYDQLTYPPLSQRWQQIPPQGELTGLSASLDGAMVGFAISERLNPETSIIISLFVLPEYRHQGIATRLVAYLERELLQQGCSQLLLVYPSSDLTAVALEPLLKRLQWQPSQIHPQFQNWRQTAKSIVKFQ